MSQPLPIGFPGGPCHVVQRIHDEVNDPRLQGKLIKQVEQGKPLSNPEAAKIYDLDMEHGTKKIFKKIRIGPHAQYRMDLRGITVPMLRKSLFNFLMYVHNQKTRDPSLFERLTRDLDSSEGIRWEDPRLKLTVVVRMQGIDTVKIITTFWSGDPDPKPPGIGHCDILSGYSPPVGDLSGYRTFVEYADQNHAPVERKVPAFPPPTWSQMDLSDKGWTLNGPGPSGEGKQVPVRTVPKPGEDSPPNDEPARTAPKRRSIEGVRNSPRKRQRKQKGQAKVKSRMYYQKNRQKAKLRSRKRYKRLKKNPGFKKQQMIRRKNPQRFKRKRGSVLTSPEIAFVLGEDMQLGYVHSVSPMTGLVTYYRGDAEKNVSGFGSMDLPDFLAAAGFLSGQDADAMFNLVDAEVGLEGYEDISEAGLLESLSLEGIDCASEEFKDVCEKVVQKRELADMSLEELSEVESYYVQNLVYDEVSGPQFPHEDLHSGPEDSFMIDPTDDDYIYGTVDLPEDWRMASRVADFYMKKKPPEMDDPVYDRATPFLWADNSDEVGPAMKFDHPQVVQNNPGSAKVIPDNSDFVNNKGSARALHWMQIPPRDRATLADLVRDPLWRAYVNGRKKEVDVVRWLNDRGMEMDVKTWQSLLPRFYDIKTAARIMDIRQGCSPDLQQKAQGLTVKLKRADIKNLLWAFAVQGSKGPYKVRIKVLARKGASDPNKADVLASCSCPFWRWQGPEHWASTKGYLYGKPRGTASVPVIKDPVGNHGACKHVLACLNKVSQFMLVPARYRKRVAGVLEVATSERVARRYLRKVSRYGG